MPTTTGVGKAPRSRLGALSLLSAFTLSAAAMFTVAGCTSSTGAQSQQAAAAAITADDSSLTPTATAPDSPLAVDLTSAPASQPAATSAAPTTAAPKQAAAPVTHAPVRTTAAAPAPAPIRTTAPAKPSLCGAPQNPFGYNFCGRGGYIYSPAGSVCDYFSCINNFGNGAGYMVECNDGMYSMSGGKRGACSYHGGEQRAVYSG